MPANPMSDPQKITHAQMRDVAFQGTNTSAARELLFAYIAQQELRELQTLEIAYHSERPTVAGMSIVTDASVPVNEVGLVSSQGDAVRLQNVGPSLEERARQWLNSVVPDILRWRFGPNAVVTFMRDFALSVTREREERIKELERDNAGLLRLVAVIRQQRDEAVTNAAESERLKRELEGK